MKKLIFAAAAVAGMGAFALESANVVGYQEKEANVGVYNCLAATFLPVGVDGSVMTLGEIKATDEFAFGEDTIMTLTGGGGTDKTYTYCNAIYAADFGIEEGWYLYSDVNNWDGETTLAKQNSTTLPYGTMVILQTGYQGSGLIFAGQVLDENKKFTCTSGVYNMLGNATPVDRTLGDIAGDDNFAFGEDTLMTLTAGGGTDKTYTYCNETYAADFGVAVGWYSYQDVNNWDGEASLKSYNADPIPAGFGFIVQTGYGAGIIIPKAY